MKAENSKKNRPATRGLKTFAAWLLVLAALVGSSARNASAQVTNDVFANASVIAGLTGTVNVTNGLATLEACELTNVVTDDNGLQTQGATVWYRWTAPNYGTATFDTINSDFDTVLAIYTNATTTNLCTAGLLAADDNGPGGNTYPFSQLSFAAVPGTTYFISVGGNGLVPPTGNIALNWSLVPPTIPSGTFSFTRSIYVVSDQDANSPVSGTVGGTIGGFNGARVTVTRSGGSSGRVMVDVVGAAETYINTFTTNYYGTNTSYTFIDTNGIGNTTNIIQAFTVVSNSYQSKANGTFLYYVVTNAYTNVITQIYTGVATPSVFTGTNYPLVSGAMSPVPATIPGVTNGFTFVRTVNQPFPYTNFSTNFTFIVINTNDINTNFIGSVNPNFTFVAQPPVVDSGSVNARAVTLTNLGRVVFPLISVSGLDTYTNPTIYWTNTYQLSYYYGSNTVIVQTAPPGLPLFFTNAFYTNYVYTNFSSLVYAVYTNSGLGLTVTNTFANNAVNYNSGVTNFTFNESDNVGPANTFITTSPLSLSGAYPSNFPPIGFFNLGFSRITDTSSNIIYASTNSFRNPPVVATETVNASSSFTSGSATLTFDDYEMSKDVIVGVSPAAGPDLPVVANIPSVLQVFLSNPRLDPLESADLIPPTISGGSSEVSALSSSYPPGPSLVNFERSTFTVNKDVSGGAAVIHVQRSGYSGNVATVDYVINPTPTLSPGWYRPPTFVGGRNPANTYNLEAGSDYALPNSDFTPVTETLSWGIGDTADKLITIPILNNGLVENNADFQVQLYNATPIPSTSDPGGALGQVNYATVTVLFDNLTAGQQPAGAVDRNWNKDSAADSNPPQLQFPGTQGGVSGSAAGNGGTVYAVAEQTDGKAIVAGSFISFDSHTYNRIVRLLGNGYQDPTFLASPNSGANGGIYAVAVQPDGKIVIGGDFTSFNGVNRYRIARLNADGTVDGSFTPGIGADGTVNSLVVRNDGKVVIGGDFTTVNGVSSSYVARLNADGTVDTNFNAGATVNGPVYALAAGGATLGSLAATGGQAENVQTLNLGAITSGTVTVSYNIAGQPSTLQVYYGDRNGLPLYFTGLVSGSNTIAIPFGSFSGFTTNLITIVMNSGGGSPGTLWTYTAKVTSGDNTKLYIGGAFDTVGGVAVGGVARLNDDGSLDANFNPGIGCYNPATLITDPVQALALQPDGNLLVGGSFSYFDLASYNGIVRLTPDGSVDTTFNPGSGTYDFVYGQADTVYSIVLQSDGGIFIGGDFSQFNQTRRWGLARLFNDGSVDTSFMDTAYNQFAGLVNHYHNENALGTDYPTGNHRNSVLALAIEPGTSNIIVGGDFLRVGGGYTRRDIHPRSNVARLIGGVTPGPGNIQLTYNSYSVDKSAGTLFVSLVRTNGSLGPISATFYTNMAAPGPGVANASDITVAPNYFKPLWPTIYLGSGAVFSWMVSPGIYGPNYATIPTPVNSSANVSLTINNNTNITGDVRATIGLSNPDGSTFKLGGEYIGLSPALGSQASAPLTILENNFKPGVLGFSSPTFTVNQNAGTATITLSRTNGTDGIVSVNYATANGTATNGINYTATSGTLTFNQGVASRTFTIPIINNVTVAPDKTVKLLLSTVTGGAKLGQSNAVLTIINNNFTPGHVSFTSVTYTTNEPNNTGTALISVNRLGGSSGTLAVTFASRNLTATNGIQFTGSTNTLTWNNGDVSTKNISVPLLHDGVFTPDLTVTLRLYNAIVNSTLNTNGLGLNTNATLTIGNIDFPGTVSFTANSYSVKKNAGFALIPVVRTGGSSQTISVNYGTADGTALSPTEYTSTNGSFTFNNGEVSKFFQVPIINNHGSIGLKQLTVQLTGGPLGTPAIATLNIIDSDSVNENPGTDDTTYSSTAGFNGAVYAFALQTNNNKLVVGGDFTQANGVPRRRIARLNANGTLDASFSLPSTAMGVNDVVRAVVVQSDGRVVIGGQFTNCNSLVYNRIARLNQDGGLDSLFNVGSGADNPVYALAETFVGGSRKILVGGSFGSLNGTTFHDIGRLNDDGTPDTTFNSGGLGANAEVFALAVQPDGKMVIGGNFTNVNGVALNRIARLNVNGSVDPTFTPVTGANDSVLAVKLQLDGKILIGGAFTNVNGLVLNHIARLNSDGSTDANFTPGVGANDLVSAITLQSDTRIVLGGQFTRCSGVARSRITRLNPDGTVDPSINFGVGADGFVSAIVMQSDLIAGYPTNVPDEKIIIGGGFTHYNGNAHQHIVRIYGGSVGGVGAFQFSTSGYFANENASNAVITVIRSGGTMGTNADGSGNINVPFTTSDDTAVAGINYQSVATNVVFAMGEVQQTVNIPLIHDFVITSNLDLNLQLNPLPPADYGNQPTAVLHIANVDSEVNLSSPSYQVTKNVINGVATINVLRLGGGIGAASVIFNTTTNGTATPGLDYTPVTNYLVTFNSGVTNVAVNIPIINNSLVEGFRTVGIQLTSPVNTLLYAPSNALLTIIDTVNYPGQLAFSAPNYNVTPNDANAVLTVIRTNGTIGTLTVTYQTIALTAQPGVDYVSTNGQLTFGPGIVSQNVNVRLLPQAIVKPPVLFGLTLTNLAGGGTYTDPSNATVVISSSSTNTFLSFAAPTNLVPWNTSNVTLTVLRLYNTNGTVTVNFATTNGTAIAGTNYVATSGVLTFTNGQIQQTIVVPLIADTHTVGDQTFTVTLSNPSSGALFLPPSSETIIIRYPASLPPGFNNPQVISGDWGSTSADNGNAQALLGSPLVWFAYTATNSGEIQFETIGSVDDRLGITNLVTYMGVYTGNNVSNLDTVTVNVGMYPNVPLQQNLTAQNTFGLSSFAGVTTPVVSSLSQTYTQPFIGPSRVLFNAVAGQTYKIAVLSSAGFNNNVASPATGLIKLNWAFHPSGVFRFASEDIDATGGLLFRGLGVTQTSGLTYSNGLPMLLYRVSETEASRRPTGNLNADQFNSTIHGTTYPGGGKFEYVFDVPGLLVTVTRVAGSSGRVQVGYKTQDITTNSSLMGTNGYLVNGDLPASAGLGFTNNLGQVFTLSGDYTPVSGTLTFDDSEMSKTIFVPIADDFGQPSQNRDFLITLTNAMLDVGDSASLVQPPRLDQTFSTAVVRILDTDVSPQGFSQTSVVVTNVIGFPAVTNIATNIVWNAQPTNGVFNFQKAHYRVTRDISDHWGSTPITVYVNRMGTNNAASPTIHWRVNNQYLANNSADLINGQFPLQPGSDYATPTPMNNAGYLGLVSDFQFSANSGTISFPGGNGAFNPQPITFSIINNGLQQFNEDFIISLYYEDSNGGTHPVGMVDQTTVTILTDDNHPPAGSVDQYHNSDFSYNMLAIHPTVPPQQARPGTDGEVLGLVVQPDNKTVVVGDFFTYDTVGRNCIARANTDGSLDTTFDPGSGANSFISSVVLLSNGQFLIGGDFTSYNGSLRNGLALLNSNGSVDPTFAPGQGFNGTVFALVQQPDGKILAGGDFTTYNGAPRSYVARLNLDGTLDTSFDPGTNLNASVNAIGLQASGQVILGGDFTQAGGVVGQNYLTRLNTNGLFDAAFDPGSGANAPVLSLGIQPDDSIVLGGSFTQLNGRSQNHIARLSANGFTDGNFFSGTGVDGPVYSITINTNAIFSTGPNTNAPVITNLTIYIGGAFTEFNNTHRLGFARLNSEGTLDTTFLDTAYNQFAGLPRERYTDPLGTVLAAGIQTDGNVMIGGSFERVGGGQSDDYDVRPESTDIANLIAATNSINSSTYGYSSVQKTRTGIRNRNNVARLIGGATPGPGNIGLLNSSYSINKSQTPMLVSLIRSNGTLGPATANFSVLSGLAQSGLDYSFSSVAPTYWISWQYENASGRMHSDGLYGTNGSVQDLYNRFVVGVNPYDLGTVSVDILNSSNSFNNLTARFQMSDPIGADQFYLGGEDVPLGVALGQSLAPMTLIDDHHQSGVFGFSTSNYVGSGASATLTVNRTNGTFGVVSMSYSTFTNASTAIANSDYIPTSGILSFNAGVTSQNFNIQLLNTNYNSTVEKFVNVGLLNLNPPFNGLASFGQTNTVLRIINANFQGFLNLSASAYNANLSDGSVVVTVTRTVGSKGTLTVQYATTNGTAVSGTDYVGSTNTLSWNNGDVTPRTITIPLLNNGLVGAGKQFGINLFNPALNAVSTPALFAANGITNAVINLNNNNSYGQFSFSSPVYVVNEQGGSAAITVIRTGGTNGTATVNYATSDNTAYAVTNYVATNNTLTFVPGQLAATFQVKIINDGKVNPPPAGFYFNVALSGASAGASVGATFNAAVQIVDADSFNRPPGDGDTTFNSGAGMNGDVLTLALQSNGKIVAGGNFIAVSGVPEHYISRLNADGSLDRSGFFYGLSGPSGTVYALANQTDDQLLIGGVFTNLNGTVLNRIARLNTDGSIDSSFNPGAGADSTVYGLAETFVNGARKVYAGGAFNTMNGVTRPNLARLNNDGTVDLAFNPGGGPNGTVYAVAVYPTNSVFAGKMLIGGAFTNVNNYPVSGVARLNVDGSTDTNFDLNLSTSGTVRAVTIQSDGKVLIGGDFTNVNASAHTHLARLNSNGSVDNTFTASAGATTNGTVNAIGVQLDGRIVVVGQFTQANGVTRNSITRLLADGTTDPTINFGDGANGAVDALVIQPADQMLVIGGGFTQYNDQPAGHIARIYGGSIVGSGAFQFITGNYSVHESGVQASITVRRVGGTSGPNLDGTGNVSVNFATANGTAIAGINYSNRNVNLVFPPGEVLQTVAVPVVDDSNITANLTVNLTLSSPTAPASLGDQATSVLNIINDDNAVKFNSGNYSVAKNVPTGFGTLVIARVGTTNGVCTVNYFTATNGSAVIGTDYFPTNGLITFNSGETTKNIQIPIISNGLVEGNRSVVVALTNAVGTLINSPSNATLTIVDTVNAPGVLSFAPTNYVANSSDGDVFLTVQRTFGTSGSVSASFTTIPGTAQYPLNYSTLGGTVTFNDGDTSKTFPVHVINNPVPQGPVSLLVQLSSPTGGATLADPTNSTLTILNTNIGVAFALATNVVNETAGTVLVYVQRFGGTNGTTTVNYATHNGSAHSGVNYVANSGTLTFLPGQVLKPIPISLINNPQVTGDLAFTVGLSGAGVTIINPGTTTVLMQDQDAGLSFDTSTNTVLRNSGLVTISVVCSNPRVEPPILSSNSVPLSVHYYSVDGTAHAGQDYLAVSGTLVFTNGTITNTFTVPIINNGLISGNRAFSLVLTNPTAPGQVIAPSTETITIADSSAGMFFSQSKYTVFKDGLNANITVYRSGYTNSTASVNFMATNGTAVNGQNFVATNGTLVFTNGVTQQSFNVPILANNLVQPNLTVLLQLSNPNNGTLVAPSAATLTILENSGSYVIPAGAMVVTNYTSHSNSGIINPNDTVQVLFAFRVAAGLNVTNLNATLLASNGVLSPSPSGPQNYGLLTTYGHSVSRPFTFTASGTNTQLIAPTFNLYNTNKFIGTASFGFTLGNWTNVFWNSNSIIINDFTNASPYPAVINVSGVGGSLIKATVTLNKLSHTSPSDVDALVVSPAGFNTLLMANAGGQNTVTNIMLTFDDDATNSLSHFGQLSTGTNKPTAFLPVRIFP